MTNRLIVIGGGIAGLHCASSLVNDFEEVIVIEKSGDVGGLAKSINYKGDYLEKFYHYYGPETPHIFELLKSLKLEHLIKWTKVKRGSFFSDGIFPMEKPFDLLTFKKISLLSRFRLAIFILATRYFISWEKIDNKLAATWLIKWVGQDCYDVLWEPLIRLKFKEFHKGIPAPFIWSRIKIQTEKIAYIEGGLNKCIESVEKKFKDDGGKLLLNTEIKKIRSKDNKISGVVLRDGTILEASKVISTLPTPILKNLCEFKGLEKKLIEEKEWMGVVCVVLLVEREITEFMWLNLISQDVPFVGLIDYTHLNPNYRVDGCRVIYVPDYVSTEHPNYKMNDEKLIDNVFDNLVKINKNFKRNWVKKSFVFRAPYAQNIPFVNFKDRIVPEVSDFKNLHICDWSQFYPWDRGLSNSLKIANNTIKNVKESISI